MPSPLKNIRSHVEPMWSLWDCEQWINLLGWLAAFQLIDTCNNTEIPLKQLNLTRESSHRPLRMQRSSSWSLLHVFISTDARKPRTGTCYSEDQLFAFDCPLWTFCFFAQPAGTIAGLFKWAGICVGTVSTRLSPLTPDTGNGIVTSLASDAANPCAECQKSDFHQSSGIPFWRLWI